VLHTRRSLKWDRYPADVLSATVAEMDFPIAPPVAAALHSAIDRHDLGYAHARIPRLTKAFSRFAARNIEPMPYGQALPMSWTDVDRTSARISSRCAGRTVTSVAASSCPGLIT